MLRFVYILTGIFFFLSFCSAQTPDSLGRVRYKYDFVVPDNGNFVAAIRAANNRKDKTKRFRIFVKSSMYRVKGEGNPSRLWRRGRNGPFRVR